MRLRLQPCLLLIALLLFPASAIAQAGRPAPTLKWLRFRITEVLWIRADSAQVRLEAGTSGGVLTGMVGEAISVRRDSMTSRGGSSLGDAQVLLSDSTGSLVAIKLTDGSKPEQRVFEGDLVSLQLEERYSVTPTLLTELVTRRIIYRDDDGGEFYRFWKVLQHDNDSLMTPALIAMAADLHAVAKRVDTAIAADDQLRQPIEKGRYKGRSVLAVLASATPEDLSRYLDFVVSYPGHYLGRSLHLGSAFAAWIGDDATPGKAAVRDELLAAKSDDERRQLIKSQPNALSDGVWLGEWRTQTTRLAEARRFDEARALNHISSLVVEVYDLKEQRGLVLFEAAQIEFHAKNRDAAIAGYRAAIPALQAADDEQGVRYALNNIADELNQLGRYVDAMAVWDT
ncbi:MAG: hypothetical protein ABI742_11390, partial [Gemmatimonadota bacterium]